MSLLLLYDPARVELGQKALFNLVLHFLRQVIGTRRDMLAQECVLSVFKPVITLVKCIRTDVRRTQRGFEASHLPNRYGLERPTVFLQS